MSRFIKLAVIISLCQLHKPKVELQIYNKSVKRILLPKK